MHEFMEAEKVMEHLKIGFGWDFSGTITDFNGGKLSYDSVYDGYKNWRIVLRLDPKNSPQNSEPCDSGDNVEGDGEFSSDNECMQKLNPTVYEFEIWFNEHYEPPVKREIDYSDITDILTWIRMRLADFGCMLETKYGYRDTIYNCRLKNNLAKTDPNNNKLFYDEIQVPDSLVSRIGNHINKLHLYWVQGVLHQINISFSMAIDTNDLKNELDIDTSGQRNYRLRMFFPVCTDSLYHLCICDGWRISGSEADCGESTKPAFDAK